MEIHAAESKHILKWNYVRLEKNYFQNYYHQKANQDANREMNKKVTIYKL